MNSTELSVGAKQHDMAFFSSEFSFRNHRYV